jgi:hypothetical protein
VVEWAGMPSRSCLGRWTTTALAMASEEPRDVACEGRRCSRVKLSTAAAAAAADGDDAAAEVLMVASLSESAVKWGAAAARAVGQLSTLVKLI